MQKIIIKNTLMFFLLMVCNVSYAQLFQNLLLGNAKAISLGNAVTADPPGIDAIHFNPAGLTRLKGRQYELKIIAGDISLTGEFQANNQEFKDDIAAKGFTDPLANTSSTIDKFAVYLPGGGHTALPVLAAPLGGVSYNRKGSKFTFANAVYAPMIFGMTRKDDDPGIVYGKEFSISRITYLSPSVGYELTDRISIGFSVGLSYVGLGAVLPFRSPSLLVQELTTLTNQVCGRTEADRYVLEVPGLDLCGGELDPFQTIFDVEIGVETMASPTYNLGALWDVTDWLTLGIAYQSEAADVLKGPISLGLSSNFHPWVVGISESEPFGIEGLLDTIVKEAIDIPDDGVISRIGKVKLITPQHLALGISVQALPKLKINFDVKWTETSKWDTLTFDFGEDIGLIVLLSLIGIEGADYDKLVIPRFYEDTVNWGIGFEYDYSPKLSLRLGYEPRKTGIPDDKKDFLVPLGDIDIIALGFSYRLAKERTFDFAFFQIKHDDFIETGTSTNGNDTRLQNFLYNPTAGLDTKLSLTVTVIEMSYRKSF